MFVLLSVSDKNISGDDIFPMKGIHHLRFSFIILSPHPLLDLQLPQKSVGSEFGDQWTSVDFAYHFKAETGSSLFINKYSLQHDFWGGGQLISVLFIEYFPIQHFSLGVWEKSRDLLKHSRQGAA